MKSIQTKFLIIILICVLVASGINSFAGMYMTSQLLESNANEIISLKCEQNANDLDQALVSVEQSVNSLASHALEDITSVKQLWEDQEYREAYIADIEEVSLNHVKEIEGALSVFMAFNPEYTSPTEGFFWRSESVGAELKQVPRTNLLAYDKDDMEAVGWYYIPVENGVPTWLSPYQNENINEWLISYVVPIMVDDISVGVIGVEIDFGTMERAAEAIEIYKTGFAFLAADDGKVMYHPEYKYMTSMENKDDSLDEVIRLMEEEGDSTQTLKYTLNGEKKQIAFQKLRNNMYFCIVVLQEEIHQKRNELIQQNLLFTFLIICMALVLGNIFCKKMVKPLMDLNLATRKVAQGEWNIRLEKTTNDEIGELTESFQKTIQYLNKYVKKVNSLAYKDSMTGVRNKTAYKEMEERLNERIAEGTAKFAVVVFDINDLKQANDTYGHMAGDSLICCVSKYICDTFKHSQVYRVGGDEFVSILETADLENCEDLEMKFKQGIENLKLNNYPLIIVSAASGLAIYDAKKDSNYMDVFKRADAIMYKNKEEMKK